MGVNCRAKFYFAGDSASVRVEQQFVGVVDHCVFGFPRAPSPETVGCARADVGNMPAKDAFYGAAKANSPFCCVGFVGREDAKFDVSRAGSNDSYVDPTANQGYAEGGHGPHDGKGQF